MWPFKRKIEFTVNVVNALKPEPMTFSKAVGDGYVDKDGKWYATQREAEAASATAYMVSGINRCDMTYMRASIYGGNYVSPSELLKQRDTKRAMAILSSDA